jgi:serine/threonine protein kinase
MLADDDETPTMPLRAIAMQSGPGERAAVKLPSGTVLRSRYALQQVIGAGASSIVFRARDLEPAAGHGGAVSSVAIKLLRREHSADPMALLRLQREFQQMQCLSHAGIARVFELDRDGDACFMSMELVPGGSVKSWIDSGGSYDDALRIISSCCEALDYAHSLGILHGDLKPSNVLVTEEGTVKLIDFGSAPSSGDRVPTGPHAAGVATPLYASPQILAGKDAEPRDDIFSLACLSYSILSGGRHPFGGRPSLEGNRAKSAPTYVRAIPPELFEVIERGLSAEHERRPASVAQFLRDLTDAERRRRSTASAADIAARERTGALRGPATISAPAGQMPPSTLPAVFDSIRLRVGSLFLTNGFRAAPAPVGNFAAGREVKRRAEPIARLIPLVVAIAAGTLFTWHDAQRELNTPARPISETSSLVPDLLVSAQAQAAMPPDTRSSPQGSGVISFEAPTMHASAAQTLIAIQVKRARATGQRAAFVWRVERGTASPGVDYQPIAPQRVQFAEGQAVRTLFIPLMSPLLSAHSSLPAAGPRTFTVALQQVAGGAMLGRIARVTVAIDPSASSTGLPVFQARTAR